MPKYFIWVIYISGKCLKADYTFHFAYLENALNGLQVNYVIFIKMDFYCILKSCDSFAVNFKFALHLFSLWKMQFIWFLANTFLIWLVFDDSSSAADTYKWCCILQWNKEGVVSTSAKWACDVTDKFTSAKPFQTLGKMLYSRFVIWPFSSLHENLIHLTQLLS